MERGSSKHGPMVDDELGHESESLTRGSPTEARAEEEREKEGPGEDEPTPDARIAGDRGLAPTDWLKPENLEWRNEVQRFLQQSVFPAKRRDLLKSAEEMSATDNVKDLLRSLPEDRTYENVQEIWIDLGGPIEGPHM